MTRLLLCAGSTRTAAIDGISAAGADPALMAHTPSADAEILAYGRPVRAPVVPVSPTGCPTPAVVTRAVVERLDLDATVVDAGLAEPTAAPTVDVGASPGGDVREPDPVPAAPDAFAAARQYGRRLPDDEVFLAETVPGGTTTALGVLTVLGDADVLDAGGTSPDSDRELPDGAVSSSLSDNPLALKRRVVAEALAASGLEPGAAAGDPIVALRRVGDPVLAVVCGLAAGALETDTDVTLAGGTQLVAAGSCLRHDDGDDVHANDVLGDDVAADANDDADAHSDVHAEVGGRDGRLSLATTSFVADDPAIDLERAAAALDLSLTVTDPGFTDDHPATAAYLAGEAKEGVGMGGALALADREGLPMADVRTGVREVYDRLLAETDREVPRP